jgi:hypothetical protein
VGGDRARLAVVGRDAVLDQRSDVGEAGVLPDRPGAGKTQLDAVVLGRVVAGGQHHARDVEAAGREVDHVGAREPRHHDVRALTCRTVGNGLRQRNRRFAHVVRDHDLRRLRENRECRADRVRYLGVELVGYHTTDVVCLDDLG